MAETLLSGQVALVTGASRGIGLAIAKALADAGAQVWLAATQAARLHDVQADIAAGGGAVEAMTLDVTDRAACFAAVKAIERSAGHLDILVNSAGVHTAGTFLAHTPADFDRMIAVNLHGTINTMQAALPSMIGRSHGRVINIASTAGKWGSLNQSAYNVSKHAVVGLTRCVALETAAAGVTVNAICPGLVQTDMLEGFWAGQAQSRDVPVDEAQRLILARVPQGRLLDPSEIAALAVFLASPGGRGMTGQSVLHDGGMVLV
ncbi:SDR family NAD(P)-dependent oxidoreductase [Phenylobacterium sp.]|jgi:NAD(P)-dependent dehydrogenase (short-subunit alcohol dehydrogenase family)|uniref:SDR family NAD(P)-dependent oxidoreductase n=1 Tax=Phenylobacterium sp. TaxID=1871053 RepID=UPI002E31B071|nr:SDR family NAD(P)-dependent oxidoreductase [Phenylobacterium sp.]HEX3367266.1 SDR family NAD(P)-dependent oxidoreductase [Phenylobacterium sp.]